MPNRIVEDLIKAVAELHTNVEILANDVKWIKRGLWATIVLITAGFSGMVPFILGHIQWH